MWHQYTASPIKHTVYPKKYAHGFCFAVFCCSYTLTDFPISTRLTSLALWQSNDCPSASKATLMNIDKYYMIIHYERLHNHNKAKHNKPVCIFLGIYCNTMLLHCIQLWLYHELLVVSCNQYRKTSSISRTKSQNLNVSCIPLQLSSLNPMKPGVKLRIKM